MKNSSYDLVILGGGCAGLTAAIYAGRAKLPTLVLESAQVGGQILSTNEIENYPGVMPVTGPELAEQLRRQVSAFDVELKIEPVLQVQLSGIQKEIVTGSRRYFARAVILATGAVPRLAGFAGETAYRGRGVSYCATCDAFFFRDREVFVIGGGNSAAQEALYLTKFARKVQVLVRGASFRCEKALQEELLRHPQIEVRFHTELARVWGDGAVQFVELWDKQAQQSLTLSAEEHGFFGIFVFAGYQPASELFRGQIELDDVGYIKTDDHLNTNLPGVYAAGDVRQKLLRQIVTATADGALAATQAETYLERQINW